MVQKYPDIEEFDSSRHEQENLASQTSRAYLNSALQEIIRYRSTQELSQGINFESTFGTCLIGTNNEYNCTAATFTDKNGAPIATFQLIDYFGSKVPILGTLLEINSQKRSSPVLLLQKDEGDRIRTIFGYTGSIAASSEKDDFTTVYELCLQILLGRGDKLYERLHG